MTTDITQHIKEAASRTEATLQALLTKQATEKKKEFSLNDAMRYSLFCGGKRLRPYLVFLFCRMLKGSEQAADVYAAAMELIHTSSLIHDDMPCIDNDDLRRGRATCHRVYGEAGALLAGDAMQMKAFEILSNADLPPESAVKAMNILASAAGEHGMLGGQMLDMHAEKRELALEELYALHTMKTGALIRASVRLGCLAASVEDERILSACDTYALNIGIAFQIVDDILDCYGNAALLGKNTGSDRDSGKTTFLSFYDREKAMKEATSLTERAIAAIGDIDNSGEAIAFARYLLTRKQ